MNARAAAPLLGALIAAGLLVPTLGLDAFAREGQLGPAFWPRMALLGLAAACLVKVAQGLVPLAGRVRSPASVGGAEHRRGAESETSTSLSKGKLTAAIALVLAYVSLAPPLGFALITAGFICGFLWVGGMRSPSAIVANVVIGTVALLYLFVKVVYLPLPKGDGPFEALTLALYRALRLF